MTISNGSQADSRGRASVVGTRRNCAGEVLDGASQEEIDADVDRTPGDDTGRAA